MIRLKLTVLFKCWIKTVIEENPFPECIAYFCMAAIFTAKNCFSLSFGAIAFADFEVGGFPVGIALGLVGVLFGEGAALLGFVGAVTIEVGRVIFIGGRILIVVETVCDLTEEVSRLIVLGGGGCLRVSANFDLTSFFGFALSFSKLFWSAS
jgi:hypothetical protein